jgi:hypothetical protein
MIRKIFYKRKTKWSHISTPVLATFLGKNTCEYLTNTNWINNQYWLHQDSNYRCPDGGVVKWTSHPPQEREDRGLNPAKV